MAKCRDFRVLTTGRADNYQATLGLTGVVTEFCNASGVLCTVDSTGYMVAVGQIFTGISQPSSIATGQKQIITGNCYGFGNSAALTGLASPNVWLPVFYDGKTYSIPGYLTT